MNLIITAHAKERYAERIMDREDKTSITVFISQHENKIQQDIEKMIEFGELIYSGNTFKDNQIINVYLNGLWVLLLGQDNKTVITLYQVDLGVDEELNKIFVDKMYQKIKELNDNHSKLKEEVNNLVEIHTQLIKDNEQSIKEMRKTVNALEEQNEAYKNYIIAQNNRLKFSSLEVRNLITKLVGKNRLEV